MKEERMNRGYAELHEVKEERISRQNDEMKDFLVRSSQVLGTSNLVASSLGTRF
jgi:hypothetical protein